MYNSIFTKWVIYWKTTDEKEVFTYHGAYVARLHDIIDYGYVENEDYITWSEF